MPIRIYESPDPLSDRTTGIEGELPLLIDSDAARLLVQEIKRYCHGEVTGRSFLIAGHRGAGKTTMVADAVLRVQRAHEEAQRRAPAGTDPKLRDARMLRPLFVPLHGPSILPDPRSSAEIREASGDYAAANGAGGATQGGAGAGSAGGGASGGAGAGSGPGASGGAAPGASASAGGTATTYAADAAPARPTPTVPGARRDPRYADDAKIALEQITLYLHRAVARAFSIAMWARVRELTPKPESSIIPTEAERAGRPSRRHRSLLELAAQLDAEFYDFISAERLRQFWHRLQALDVGLLYRREDARMREWAARSEQGMRELVALSSVFDAYARISGKYERSESLSNDAKIQEALTASIDAPAKTLGEPLIAILTGGLVGTGVAIGGEHGLFPVIAGLLGALGASFAFKISATRTRDRAAKAGYSFVYEKTEATLDRLIPVIIERLRLAGLAPIFVVDELDKVTDIGDRMAGMVHYLKKLVAESAFFCFLTDRAYFELVWNARHSQAYPVDYSYFTFTPYVVFREDDLHAYLDRVLRVEEPSTSDALAAEDEADKRVLRYVLLHRARMHTLDLRRHLAAIRGDDGEVNIRRGTVRTDYDYRFDVLLQLGIEYVLSRRDLAKRMAREPEFRQVAYDAMFFLSRAWVHRALEAVDLRDEKLEDFHALLEDRIGLERTRSIGTTTAVAALDADDVAMLYDHVRVLAVMLAKPLYYAERLSEWRREREEQGLPAIPQAAVDALALPETPDDAISRPTLLEEVADAPLTYIRRFRPDGSAMVRRDVEEFVPRNVALGTAWSDNAAFIDAFVGAIGRVTT